MPLELVLGIAAIGLLVTLIALMGPQTDVVRRPDRRTVGLSPAQLPAMRRPSAATVARRHVAPKGAWDGAERRVAGIRSPRLVPPSGGTAAGTAATRLVPRRERTS
jgi:hypothetical protein